MAKDYPNRSDLRGGKVPKQTTTGQTYGQATQQMQAQSAVPMGQAPTDKPVVAPGSLGAFNRPTERPMEPVTAGASFGPGPTPRTQFAPPVVNDKVLTELRALYADYPSDELADMLDSYVREGY